LPQPTKTHRCKLLPALLLVASLATLGTTASAEDGYVGGGAKKKDDFARPGGYLSLGVGGANSTFTGDFDVFNDFLSQALIIGLRGGQRLNRFFAFDVSLDYSAIGFETTLSNGASAEMKSVTGFGNLKLYPIGGRIQPYAMGGVGFVWGALNCYDQFGNSAYCGVPDEDIVFAGRAGGGLDIYLTPSFAISGEVAYVMPTDTFKDLNYLSYMGHLVFRF